MSGFDRLPPTVLAPTAKPASSTPDRQTSPSARWFATVLAVNSTGTRFTVHIKGDPEGHNGVIGSEIAGVAVGNKVIVGFFADNSMAIVAIAVS